MKQQTKAITLSDWIKKLAHSSHIIKLASVLDSIDDNKTIKEHAHEIARSIVWHDYNTLRWITPLSKAMAIRKEKLLAKMKRGIEKKYGTQYTN